MPASNSEARKRHERGDRLTLPNVADGPRPCTIRLTRLGSQPVCARCGDDCDCYVCTHEDAS